MASPSSIPQRLLGGVRTGLAFGLASSLVHLVMGIGLIWALGMPPMTWFAARTLPMELTVALLAGILTCPLALAPRGHVAQPIALFLLWVGLERWVAIDPSKLQMWLAPPVGALVVYGIGVALYRWKRWMPVAVAAVLAAVALAVPVVKEKVAGTSSMPEEKRGTAPAGAPDILFLVMDTVRAKSVSAYGYSRPTTPNFDALAREGVLFTEANAASTWSLPAHAALFTGAFPSVNNAHDETRYLDERLPTLASTLAEAGWETLCFTANPHVSPSFGLTRGFHWSDNAWITGAGGRSFTFIYRLADSLGLEAEDKGGGQVVRNIERWVENRPADGPPAFLFVNFLEAHFPFHQLPEQYREAFAQVPVSEMRAIDQIATGVQFGRQLTDEEVARVQQPIIDLYDGGVQYTDALLGQVIELLRKKGTLDNTIILVLADHGEFTGEHRSFGHHSPVYQEALHVPFMIRYPKRIQAGSRVEVPVSTVGTFATLLDLAGVSAPPSVQIGSLLPALEGRTAGQPVMAERFEEHMLSARFSPGTANGVGPLLSPRGRYRVYRMAEWKLAHHWEQGKTTSYLFNLKTDPGELTDVAGTATEDLVRMESELSLWEKALRLPPLDVDVTAAAAAAPEMDAAAQEQLRALGYVE